MKVLAACAVVVGSSVGLLGCGGSDDPAPAPAPAPVAWPKDVATVWKNHLDAFKAAAPDDIIKDYDDDSVVSTFNDHCADNNEGFRYYKGQAAIKGMFVDLFKQLDPVTQNVVEIGPTKDGAAKVINEQGLGGNVFLTWKTKGSASGENGLPADKWIQYATDTFSFQTKENGDYKILKQNIVLTMNGVNCSNVPSEHAQMTSNIKDPNDGSANGKIEVAWKNHFDGFGKGNVSIIAEDYTKDSIVQVYDWTQAESRFKEYKGVAQIEGMFTDLFEKLNSPESGAPDGVSAPLLTVDADSKSIFLVWRSTNVKHATDTFIFDDSGDKATILRQNIVIHADPEAGPGGLQIEV